MLEPVRIAPLVQAILDKKQNGDKKGFERRGKQDKYKQGGLYRMKPRHD